MNLSPGYPDRLEIVPFTGRPIQTVTLPGSKSLSNRAMVLAALAGRPEGCLLRGVLHSEDTVVMADSLARLGFDVDADWSEGSVRVGRREGHRLIPGSSADLQVANSGTTMRFLTALVGVGQGRYRLDGVARMRERPIEDLLVALRQLGVNARSERNNGCPPVVVNAAGMRGGKVLIKGEISSQFLSGLLMAASAADDPVEIRVEGPLVSRPYVDMTLAQMRQWGLEVSAGSIPLTPTPLPGVPGQGAEGEGADVSARSIPLTPTPLPGVPGRGASRRDSECSPACYRVPGSQRSRIAHYEIEPDASAASYFWAAAALTGGRIRVAGLTVRSLQGDVRFADVLGRMGCEVEHGPDGIAVGGGGRLRGIDVDMNDISDTVMTLAVVACFADGPTVIRNVGHVRHKETDRLAALATELRRLGAGVEEREDGLTIAPRVLHGTSVATYDDHRMAMSLALAGLRVPGVVIQDPGCVVKTYPHFFEDFEKLRP